MDCRTAIYSNDYYDFIDSLVEKSDMQELAPACTQPLALGYEVSFYERRLLRPEDFTISNYTYFGIPTCYGLMETAALEDTGILTMQNYPNLELKGAGVLMGFIDTGIEYTHPAFLREDGATRILRIWDQTIQEGNTPEGFLYGAEYSREQINEALQAENPYDIVPSRDTNGHGTFLAGVAAGSVTENGEFSGAVPQADIAVVKLKEAKQYLREFYHIADDVVVYQENDIMAAIFYLHELAYALDKPLVICLGIGTNSNGHNSSSPLSGVLNYVGTRRMRCITIAAGNEANKRHHFQGEIVSSQAYEEVELRVGEKCRGFIAELWTNAPELVSVGIQSPTGEAYHFLPFRQGVHIEYEYLLEGTTVSVDYVLPTSVRNNQLAFMRFTNPEEGVWKIRAYSENFVSGNYHIWLPIEEFLDSEVFFLRSNPDTTVTGPGDAMIPITAGGYQTSNGSIFLDSGRGFTITNQVKPDLLAPAVEVYGPALRGIYTEKSGTSIAAAVTAGAAAQLMEWGIVLGNDMTMNTVEIKNYLIVGAHRDAGTTYPNKEEGYGSLDVYQAFLRLRG